MKEDDYLKDNPELLTFEEYEKGFSPEPVSPWIPVCESLPDLNQEVLVVMEWYGKTINVIAKLYSHPNAWMFTFPKRPEESSIWRYASNSVIAWMPIPALTLTSAPALVPDVANGLDKAEQSYNAAGWKTERKDEQSILFSKPAPTYDNEIDIPINWEGAKW